VANLHNQITIALEFPSLPAKTWGMPAPDSEVEPDKIPAGAAHFANTHWSIVLSDGDKRNPTRALQSLEKLCRLYWHPLYFYARRQGENPPDAQDLTQEFFARLLQNDLLDSVDRGKGRFRSFLLAAFKHFLSNERDKARAQKRGGGQPIISLDETTCEGRYRLEPAETMDAEKLFERRWALTLLEQARARLNEEYHKAGKTELYDRLKAFESGDQNAPSYAQVAAELGLTESAVKSAVFRMRQRYRELVREEVANTVESPAEIDEEIHYLIRVISG